MTGVTIQVQESENLPEVEAMAEAQAEAIETVSSDAVAIAIVEAEKEVALAEIESETRLAEAEIYTEASTENTAQDNDLWQTLNLLSSQVANLTDQVSNLLAAEKVEAEVLSSLAEAELAEAAMLTAPEQDLTLNSMSEETDLMPTEHSVESAEESLIPPLVEVSGKPIIRLI